MSNDIRMKDDWNYNIYPVYGLPMSNHPFWPLPSGAWVLNVIKTTINIIDNLVQYFTLTFYDDIQRNEVKIFEQRAIDLKQTYEGMARQSYISADQDNFNTFLTFAKDLSQFLLNLDTKVMMEKPRSMEGIRASEWGLERYNSLFRTEPLPAVAHHLRDDRVFAYWRVAGNNPVMIQRVSTLPANFPLKNTDYQKVMGTSDSLKKAIADNRLYIIDYKDIGAMANEEGYYKSYAGLTYAYAPIALFAVAKGEHHLMPVAIQTGQDPHKHNIFLRIETREYFWGWQMAKYIVQVAEENYHEIFTHLAYTHLISEVFAVATVRNFSSLHVIYNLLRTHFEGTKLINYGATAFLIREHQFIDNLFYAEIGEIQNETLLKRFSFDFFAMMLPNDLERRGVKDKSIIAEYPYRDDGMLVWNAIYSWVNDYVNLYYLNDNDVVRDVELNCWVDDIILHGKINGFKKITSVKMLKDVLTMVIFTASAQHAAVNFTQPEWMRYAPAIGATSAARAPYSPYGRTNSEWLSMLQNYNQVVLKYFIYSLLGGVYHGQLGKYTEPKEEGQSVFQDARVIGNNGILKKFRNELANIENEIIKNNINRPLPYTALLPSRIPASTNI